MPLHETRWMSKDAAVRAMIEKPRDREAPARDLIGSFGGRMHHHHLMPGEYDRLAVVEFPDDASAAATSMRAGASGAFARFGTHPLLTAREARRAMRTVEDGTTAYRAPNA